jgi:large subunit ribosomal protein L23
MGILNKLKKTSTTEVPEAEVKKVAKTSAKTVVKKVDEPKVTPVNADSKIAYKILIRPMVTEKAADLAAQGKYVFEVAQRANKIQVAQAVKETYNVDVAQVNIQCYRGKVKYFGRTVGKRKDYKKAIVTLKKGQTMQVFEGV